MIHAQDAFIRAVAAAELAAILQLDLRAFGDAEIRQCVCRTFVEIRPGRIV